MSKAATYRDDVSSISDIEDRDYQTDYTSPASSDSGPDEFEETGEIEEFRDREYPQLQGIETSPSFQRLSHEKLAKLCMQGRYISIMVERLCTRNP